MPTYVHHRAPTGIKSCFWEKEVHSTVFKDLMITYWTEQGGNLGCCLLVSKVLCRIVVVHVAFIVVVVVDHDVIA